jgi:hypothetical protein
MDRSARRMALAAGLEVVWPERVAQCNSINHDPPRQQGTFGSSEAEA